MDKPFDSISIQSHSGIVGDPVVGADVLGCEVGAEVVGRLVVGCPVGLAVVGLADVG